MAAANALPILWFLSLLHKEESAPVAPSPVRRAAAAQPGQPIHVIHEQPVTPPHLAPAWPAAPGSGSSSTPAWKGVPYRAPVTSADETWVPDIPLSPGVAEEAKKLLPVLWADGAGTEKVVQTDGRDIKYVATQMGEKKGVVAYKRGTPGASTPASSSIHQAPTLSLTHPYMRGAAVKTVQTKLGVKPVDGIYGPQTQAAVIAFQKRRGLKVDGIVGPQTWGALG